jgi:hypothetical protein
MFFSVLKQYFTLMPTIHKYGTLNFTAQWEICTTSFDKQELWISHLCALYDSQHKQEQLP